MLKFARSKLVSVYRKDENTLLLHGILDDDIYGIEMDVKMEIPSRVYKKNTGYIIEATLSSYQPESAAEVLCHVFS